MKSKDIFKITALLLLLLIPAQVVTQEKSTFFTSAQKISDKVMYVNTSTSFARQLVLNSEKGLVVFNTAWADGIAREYQEWVKKTFNKDNYYLVVNLSSDLMDVGGNATYKDALIVSNEIVYDDLVVKSKDLKSFVQKRQGVFIWKVNGAQEHIDKDGKDTEAGKGWISWRDICQRVADDLNENYRLRLPDITFRERMSFDLGDITLQLINFGECDDRGAIWVYIPEEGLLVTGSVLTTLHLSPTLQANPNGFDVQGWIDLAEEFIDPAKGVKEIVTAHSGKWTIENLKTRHKYWSHVWNAAKAALKAGKNLEQFMQEENFDDKYSYIKEWPIYKMNHSEENWVLNEHTRTLKCFYLEASKKN